MLKQYKGYAAGPIQVDDATGALHGRVRLAKDVVTFEAMTAEELQQAFRDSIDAYLQHCNDLGREPESP